MAVCVKWVDRRPELDASGAAAPVDDRFAGISLADRAALEIALRSSADVTVVTVGPAAAERTLRDALACGAARAVRIDAPHDLDSAAVARALAGVVVDARITWCGDHSPDRGSGSVPAFLAAELVAAQLLGLVEVSVTTDDPPTITATRRLDGGRREILCTSDRAVCSVEGAVAHLRRAPLGALLAASDRTIEVRPGPGRLDGVASVTRPYRPRARVVTPPSGDHALDRVRDLIGATGATGSTSGAEAVTLDPPDAAARILRALTDWGYLDPTD